MPSYRYPGPRPFEETDINLFFGRDKDKKNLLTFINVEPLVVLFSKSGLGKSSLVNAAIIPELRKKNYEIILCRFNSYVSKEPGENSYEPTTPLQKVFNEIEARFTATTTFLDKIIEDTKQLSLWHQFKSLQISGTEKKTYFIFFDQFEELFTYPADQVKEFKENLAELLNASVPQEYLDQINKSENSASSEMLTDEQLGLLYEPIPVKLLFTIRSDKFSLLTNLKDAIPGMVTKTYELKPFDRIEATKAIKNPASIEDTSADGNFISNAFTYDDDAIKKMLNYLTDNDTEDIESFQLQVLCRYVEEMVLDNKRRNNELKNITASQLGEIKNVFEDYYNKLINDIDKDKIKNVKKLFEDGLIFEKDKIRVSLYEGQIADYGVDETLLNTLVSTHLIRCEPDANGREKYELSHDSLIEPILKAKEKRMVDERAGLQRKNLRKKVTLFSAIGGAVFIIFAVILSIIAKNSKRDKLEINFLVAEKDWFYLLDSAERKDVLKNDFLFLGNKDSTKYQDIKYSFKCAAYANLNAENNYLVALQFAQEGYLKNANAVTERSFDTLLHKPGTYFPSFKIHCSDTINNVKLLPDQKNIIAVTTKGIFWYDAAKGTVKDSLTAPQYESNYSVFTSKGDYLLYETFYSDTTYLLNTSTKQLQHFIFSYNKQPHSIAFDIFSDSDKYFVHSNGEGKINVFSFNGNLLEQYALPIENVYDKINELSLSPHKNYIAVGTNLGKVFLVNREDKKITLLTGDSANEMQTHSEIVNSVSFSHDGQFVLTGSSDNHMNIWSVEKKQLVDTLNASSGIAKCHFSSNDSSVYAGLYAKGTIIKWKKGGTDLVYNDSSRNIGKRNRTTMDFSKTDLQYLGLNSNITSLNLYNDDSKFIASSNNEISVWDLNKKSSTVNQVVNFKAIEPLPLHEKVLWNMALQKDIEATTSKQEILKTLSVLNDTLNNLTSAAGIKMNKQTIIDYTNLMAVLYQQLQYCKNDKLSKLDSYDLSIYMGNCYIYKIRLDEATINGRFGSDNLIKLIRFRQMPFALDTLFSSSFHNLFEAYFIPIDYYFNAKQYDSLLYWNDLMLKENTNLLHIPEIQNDLMIWHQYNVCFHILLNDIEGARRAFQQWPELHDNISYVMTKELMEIYTNPSYVYNEANFKKRVQSFDLTNEYNKNDVADMDNVVYRLVDEAKSRKLGFNTIDNLNEFDDYLYNASE